MEPIGKNNISPLPNSFSAPTVSRIVLESILEETAKAMREGILALMTPVIISVDGLCVATPTGSTGISKSLGGAVIHPRTEAIQLTEMASVNNRVYRTLSSPMIIAKDEWIVVQPIEEHGLIVTVDHLTFRDKHIEKLVYRVANEKVHFARYRHMHFWNRVENAFIGMANKR